MKKISYILLCCVFFIGLKQIKADTIKIENDNLRKCVEVALGKSNTTKDTEFDTNALAGLTEFTCGVNTSFIGHSAPCKDKTTGEQRFYDFGNEYNTLFSKMPNVTNLRFECGGPSVNEIDVTNNTKLQYLFVSGNNLSKINGLTNLKDLVLLWAPYNNFENIDLTQNVKLRKLNLHFNNLNAIDLSKNVLLDYMWIGRNNLNSIDVSNNTKLKTLAVGTNNLTSLDVSKNLALQHLSFNNVEGGNNSIGSIDLSNNLELLTLITSNNMFSSKKLDLSKNNKLKMLNVANCGLEEINVDNTSLIIGPGDAEINDPNNTYEDQLRYNYWINISGNNLKTFNINKVKTLKLSDLLITLENTTGVSSPYYLINGNGSRCDVNGDGVINSLDYILIKNDVNASKKIDDPLYYKRADWDENYILDKNDYDAIKSISMRK